MAAMMNKQLLLLSLVTFASILSGLSFAHQSHQQQRGSWQYGQCQLDRINALEPSYQFQSEGGVSEFWDHNSQDLQCAGAAIHRHRLQSRAMMLPAYHNAPVLAYIQKGHGIFGLLISGCPETFESSEQSQQQQYGGSEEEEQQRGGRGRFRDRHQKIGHIKRGDIVAIPAGSAFWSYNNGDEELVVVVFSHTANFANQLDTNPRTFFLAGNPQSSQQQQQGQGQQQQEMGNVFRGIDIQILQEAFGIDEETARKLQGHDDQRGHLVIIERGLQVITPPLREEEEQKQEYKTTKNGLEETICTAKLRENIDNPSKADVYNPRAGRFTTVNSFTLPILDFLQLSAAKGVLYRDGMISPHWCVNSHSIVFGTRGEARIQIVDHNGRAAFDGRVRQGQVVVVPQNYAVVKQATSEQGFEWIEFNTNGNAMINTLSGRTSALRGLPNDVVANMYQISREQAEDLKYSRQETLLFSSGAAAQSSSYERDGGAVASA